LPSCTNFNTAIAVNVFDTDAIWVGVVAVMVSAWPRWPEPLYLSKMVLPFFATRMPPLKLPGFNIESYQSSQPYFIRENSALEIIPGAGKLRIAMLSLLLPSLEEEFELQETKNINIILAQKLTKLFTANKVLNFGFPAGIIKILNSERIYLCKISANNYAREKNYQLS